MHKPHETNCRDVSCHGQRLQKRGTDGQGADVRRLADVAYPIDNPAGAFSSGSSGPGMVGTLLYAPLAEIAYGITSKIC